MPQYHYHITLILSLITHLVGQLPLTEADRPEFISQPDGREGAVDPLRTNTVEYTVTLCAAGYEGIGHGGRGYGGRGYEKRGYEGTGYGKRAWGKGERR
eukprot:7263002-Pyramimonas_sp.AAC.3